MNKKKYFKSTVSVISFMAFFYIVGNSYSAEPIENNKEAEILMVKIVNERLESQAHMLLLDNTALKDEKAKLSRELAREKRDKESFFRRHSLSKEANVELGKKISSLEAELTRLRLSNEALKEGIREESRKNAALTEDIQKTEAYKKKLEAAQKQNSKLKTEKDLLIAELNDASRFKGVYLEEKMKLEGQLVVVVSDNKLLTARVAEMQAGHEQFVAESEESIACLTAKLEKSDTEKNEFFFLNQELNKRLEDVMEKLSLANRRVASLEKENGDVHYNLGVIFQRHGAYDEALEEYKNALEYKPNDGDLCYNMALIYDTFKNDREQACHYYQRYLVLKPLADDGYRVKGRVTELGLESRVWGEPDLKGIGQKEKLGRW